MAKSPGVRWLERSLLAGAVVLLLWSVFERLYRPGSYWGSNSSILLNVALLFLTATPLVRAGSMRTSMMAASGVALIAHFFVR